ncbi:uncharacterized protein FOMMEDRAFT_20017 [Fomitiporia mediterranea MF3/22]|uniref:uncharacterized protein n=1 Tax=Fomitiporia mediterranea (strain MF3/22) TaxID=694068 RepID=UPI0004409BC9|nr:uncharacterized protein FOMMEDRAFT_20017 [Fomitiporia mediterranea MF3/22]EJD02760.1 hypothetical protein FOMMEDRAFT_20017 [Fomitiporia mediterranea MF3/22]
MPLSASRSVNHTLHVFSLRFKRVNLPLLVAFFSALYIFLRALSGAGYTEPHHLVPLGSASSDLAYNQTYHANDHPLHVPVHSGFAEHWARFKESVLACPDDTVDATVPTNHDPNELKLDEGITNTNIDSVEAKSRTNTRYGVGCLKERLSNAINLRSPTGKLGSTIKKEDRAFGISFDGLPSQRRGA